MSTVNKYLLPHRATKDVMKDASKSSMVLRKGELFVEAPSTGIGTGHSKIKIGDGKTIYSNLPYALGDTDNEVTNAIITFISNTGTSAKDVINGVKSGQSLATQIAGLKQAITLIANTPFTNKAFSTISDGGNQSIAATGTGDILKVTAGDNVTLTMDNSVKSIKIAAKDTTYNNATTTTSGLMSSGDKKRFDGMSDGANKTAVEQKLFSGTNIGSVTIDGKKTELFAPTNTHYEAKNVVNNSSTSTSNTSTTVDNGNVTLNLVEDGKVRSSHKISGSGATKVTTDDSGNIIVSSTDNNTTYGQASDTKAGLTKIYGIYGDNTDGSVTQQFFTGEMNKKLNSDGTAVKANQDSLGNNIAEYFRDASVNGQTVTFVRGNGTTFEIHTQDTNNKYYDFKGATTAANGGNGLVPAPSSAQTGYYLRGDGTWHSPSDVKVDKAGMADKASTATADSAGNNINTTYIKSVTGSNATVTVTKGNGATTSFTINNVSSATSAGSARSASTATADSAGQQINTTYVKGVTGAAAVVTVTKGDGTTTGFTVDGVKSASSATADSAGQNINTTYVKGVTGSNATVTVTKGDGTTSAFTVNNVGNAGTATYAKSASTATADSAGQQINTTYIKSLSVSGRTITYTKGNGVTGSITTQDNNTTYGAFKGATSSANGGSGLVPAPTTAQKDQYLKGDGTWASISNVISGTKVDNASTADYASSASSASTATADSAGQQINTTYIKGVTGSNATLTVTKGNGSTSTFTVNNVSNAAKASTATADSAGQNINTTYIKSITYSGHTVTVTKGNGTTSSFVTADNNTTYTTGNETTSGLTKLYGSSGTSADGTMTRAAITKLVNDTKTTLETAIGNINSFEIIVLADGETLPTTGANHTVYFVPDASGDADTKYAEYIWLTDYYEKIGMTTADLTNYYTKSETDNKISFATDSLVSSLSYSGHTLTITKKNGTTSSFNTTDNNTTYSAGTGLSLSGTTFSINAGASTVAHASSADSSTNDSAGNNINNTYVKGITYSGHTVTITKGNGATTSFNTADNNTTYDVFKGATNSANGGSGLVPAPTTAQTGMYLKGDGTWANISGVIAGTKVNNASTADYASSASNSTKATNDSAGQQINTTYIKSLSVSGRTITYTKGNGATGAITTQDNNTTYATFNGATSSANGGPGLVPGPTSAQVGMYLRGDGTWHSPSDVKVNNASHADSADNASNATNASTATYAKTAGSANAVAWGNISGKPSTYTPSAHTHTSIESVQLTNQDLNNYKSNSVQFLFAGGGNTVANKPSGVDAFGVYTYRSAQGFYTQELVDTNGTKYLRFCNSTSWTAWKTIVDSSNVAGYKVNNAGYADSAGKATNDSAGQNINTTYIKNLAVSGRTITFTKGNGATGTITTQDSNTTYSAGTGLSLSGTTFSINAGASTVAHASSADSSTKDSAGNNINNTYIKNLSVNGRTITFTKGNGSTTAITTQDTNTTYDVFKGATSSANGGNGLVPAPTTAQKDMYLKGDGTWANISGVIVGTKVTSAANADSAGKATNDSAGQNINTTYIKSLSVSGRTITYTKGNGATGTITTQDTDTNTTYSAGTGLTLSGTTFSINAGASTVAYATNAGNGISNITRSGTTFTVTRQNGSTFSFNQQDTNTTYGLASQSSNGLMSAADKKAIDREFFRMLPKGGTVIPNGANLNSTAYLKVGNYYQSAIVNTTNMTNIPIKSAFMMYVLSPLSETYDNESTAQGVYRLRIFIEYTGTGMFVQRVFSDATPGSFDYGPWVKMTNSNDLGAVTKLINDHVANKSNPHAVTKAQVGLGSVANLDQSKAIKSITRSGTTFTATALDGTTTTFTQQDSNTTYGVATSSADGLMSKSDKAKLDGIDPSAITTNAANIKKNADAISAETTRAKAAEKANADTISAEVTRAKKAEEANTQLTNDLKTGLTSGTVKVAKATVADSASSLGKVSTYQTEIPDNGGRRKYLLMYDITDWISAKSNAPTRAFDGYFFSRRSGGYVGTNYTGNLSIVASYNGVYQDGTPIKSDNGQSLRLRTTSSTYVPRILHQKSNDKYYLSLMTNGSGRDLILFGIFQGTFIGTWINNKGANSTNGTLPSDYEEYSDGFYIIPYERAIADKNGKDFTEYLVAAAYADGAFTFTRGNGSKTVLTIPDAVSNTVNSHIANKSNPHGVTKAQVGLGSVANLDQSKAIKSITRSGTTFTATALDGTTTTFTQQDNNSTYNNFKGATTATAGGNGLVPAPTTAQVGFYLRGDGTWHSPSDVKANNAGYSDSAGKATNDSAGNNINTTYIKSLAVSGRTITYTKGNGGTGTITTQDTNTTYSAGTGLSLSGTTFSINAGASTVAYATNAGNGISNITRSGTTFTVTRQNGSTFSFNQQDSNTTYGNFKGATTAAAGGPGLVPAPAKAQDGLYLRGDGTWHSPSDVKANNAGYADSAGKATNDSAGNNINNTYIKSLSVSGRTITYTKGNGATGSFQTQDTNTNTTYSAGTGLALSGTTFSINAGASTVAYATNAGNGISNITRSGTTFTVTRQNGSTFSFNQQDTNTTYGIATSSADGLMSKADKAKLDGLSDSGIHYVPFKLVDDTACSTTDSFNTVMSMLQANKPVQASVNADGKTISLPVFMYDAGEIMFRNDEMYIIWADTFSSLIQSSAIYGYTLSDKLQDNDTTETSGQAALDAHMGKVLSDRINALNQSLADKLYPVGSIYMSVNNTNPGTFIGGTWERIKDRFLLAAGNTYAAGSTGGWDTHIHKYGFQYGAFFGSISIEKDDQSGALQGGTGNPVGSTVVGQAHSLVNNNVAQDTKNIDNTHYKSIADTSSASNMPPYIAVYVWKRTA